MMNNKKVKYILIINSLAMAVLSIRFQKLIFILLSIGLLLWYSIISPSPLGIGCLSVSLTFLYPGPQIGWLYIRGAHVAAYTAEEILYNGWPISTSIRRSTPGTPLVHFHAILTGEITNLSIYPNTNGEFLVTAFLPIVYSLISLLMAFVIIRKFKTVNQISLSHHSLFVPILIWAPFYWTKPAFNRQSIGFLFFICTSYSLFKYTQTNNPKFISLTFLFSLATILGHDFASFSVILLIFVVFFVVMRIRIMSGKKTSSNEITILLLLIILLFSSWQIVGGFGENRLLSTLLGMTTDRFDSIFSLVSGGSDQTQIPAAIGEPIQPTTVTIFQKLLSEFLFALIVGIGITGYFISQIYNNEYSLWVETMFIFGLFIGTVSILSWIMGTHSPDRIITYLVFVGGGIVPLGYQRIESRFNRLPISIIMIFLLLFLSISMIPLHIVSDSPPQYDQGETDQRFSKSLYATADFLDQYGDTTIYGDENVEHVIGGKTGKIINSRPEIFSTNDVPKESVVILQDYNRKYYFGASLEYGAVNFKPNGFSQVTRSNNRLYSNGQVSIYS